MRKMCFLVAKQFNQIGCFALQTEGGKPLVEMKRRLENEFGETQKSLPHIGESPLISIIKPTSSPIHIISQIIWHSISNTSTFRTVTMLAHAL